MSLSLLCTTTGINTGTIDCAPVPGVGKYLVVWGGKLTASQLAAGYATCLSQLQEDARSSKTYGGKLSVFPIIAELSSKKESNTEAKMADGYNQVTREALPSYELKIRTDLYLSQQLRKLNNKNIKYCLVDDKNLFLGTLNADGEFTGRAGKLFVDGIDVHGYGNVDGECSILLQAFNAYETFDFAAAIELDKAPVQLFSVLKDIQLYEKAASSVVAGDTVIRVSGKIPSPIATNVIDFYDDYSGSNLSSSTTLWSVTKSDGTAQTIDSVAPNAAGYFELTMTGTLTAGTYEVNLAAPGVLAVALVLGIEGIPYSFTI